ncbi:helix-turn-helix transcriptional regulator [Trinickia caryophylli]|nr:LuxR family transcriptional regulator [Trinickia caryophylli]TRX18854.1 helix-turn-helix transcriptional regulator [Trinickia caryophylli]
MENSTHRKHCPHGTRISAHESRFPARAASPDRSRSEAWPAPRIAGTRCAAKMAAPVAAQLLPNVTGEGMTPTSREETVLALIAQGMTDREIAAQLSFSISTARKHREALLAKFHARKSAQLVSRYFVRYPHALKKNDGPYGGAVFSTRTTGSAPARRRAQRQTDRPQSRHQRPDRP